LRFFLVYRGQLSSNQGKNGKHRKQQIEIRKQIDPQMRRLWETNPTLTKLQWDARVPTHNNAGGFFGIASTPLAKHLRNPPSDPPQDGMVDLTAPIDKFGRQFRPLIRNSLDLTCSLKVLFLRQEEPGALIKHGGDIDNRIKTFIDALEMPADKLSGDEDEDINYPLLENDTLVRGLSIDTERLLLPEQDYPNQVHLVVEVKVHVEKVGYWNMCLL